MDELSHAIGRIEQYQVANEQRLKHIEKRVDALWDFRMYILGAVSLAGFFGGALMSYLAGVK